MRQIWYPAFALSILLMIAVALLMHKGFVPLDELIFERLALSILAYATVLSFMRLFWGRRPFFLWLSALCLAAFCREIHFDGTSTGFYIALVVLIAVVLFKYPTLAEYLNTRIVPTLLASAFFCYFLAQTLDQQWWRFAIGKPLWSPPLEEFLEVLGHFCILLLAIFSRKNTAQNLSSARPQLPYMNPDAFKWSITAAIVLLNVVLVFVPGNLAYLVAQHRDVLLGLYGVSHFITLLIIVPVSLLVICTIWRQQPDDSTPQREKTFKTLILTLAIIFPIIVVDVGMRLVQAKRYVGNPPLFHRPPNSTKTGIIHDLPETAFTYPIPRPGYPDTQFTLTSDKRGFRNKIDLDQYDFLMLGDSFTEGSDVTDDDIWPTVFADLTGNTVYNLGMSGGSPKTYLETLKKYIHDISPQTVVCMVYEGNDFRNSNFTEKPSRTSLSDTIFKRSPLRRFFKNALIRIFGPLNAKRPLARGKPLTPDHPLYAISCLPLVIPPDSNSKYYAFELKSLLEYLETADLFVNSPGFEKTCQSLRQIKQTCLNANARLIIIYAPDKPHVLMPLVKDTLSPKRLHAFMALKQKNLPAPDQLFEMLLPNFSVKETALANFCLQENLEFVSTTEPLRQAIASGTQAYFTYDQHWTPPGHAIVAQTLHQYLTNHPPSNANSTP